MCLEASPVPPSLSRYRDHHQRRLHQYHPILLLLPPHYCHQHLATATTTLHYCHHHLATATTTLHYCHHHLTAATTTLHCCHYHLATATTILHCCHYHLTTVIPLHYCHYHLTTVIPLHYCHYHLTTVTTTPLLPLPPDTRSISVSLLSLQFLREVKLYFSPPPRPPHTNTLPGYIVSPVHLTV